MLKEFTHIIKNTILVRIYNNQEFLPQSMLELMNIKVLKE